MYNDWEEEDFVELICFWNEVSGGMWETSCGAHEAIDHPPIRCPSCWGIVKPRYMKVVKREQADQE